MNTTKIAASTNHILAIDLGKYKSVVCLLDESSGEYRFTTFDTSPNFFGEPCFARVCPWRPEPPGS